MICVCQVDGPPEMARRVEDLNAPVTSIEDE
jgi:hypothetical protein